MSIQERIWRAIERAEGPLRNADLQQRLGMERRVVEAALLRLRQLNLIAMSAHGNATTYIVPDGVAYKCPGYAWRTGIRSAPIKRKARPAVEAAVIAPPVLGELERCWFGVVTTA